MNFDYTYISIFGFPLFEPMILLTNLIFFLVSYYCFRQLRQYSNRYAKQMAAFLLLLGISSLFGSVCHNVHFQLGKLFFDVFFFFMNATSLLSIYYCFRAPYTYYSNGLPGANRYIIVVGVWVFILLAFCAFHGQFTLIKIHAAIVLLYSLAVHFYGYRKKTERGNGLIVTGLLISIIPIIVHTLKFSIHEWFNYKDLSHVIMIISMIVIFKGAILNAEDLEKKYLPLNQSN